MDTKLIRDFDFWDLTLIPTRRGCTIDDVTNVQGKSPMGPFLWTSLGFEVINFAYESNYIIIIK